MCANGPPTATLNVKFLFQMQKVTSKIPYGGGYHPSLVVRRLNELNENVQDSRLQIRTVEPYAEFMIRTRRQLKRHTETETDEQREKERRTYTWRHD